MCGILTTVNVQRAPDYFKAALATMKRRGPDASGVWRSSDTHVWLGHQRLAIVDLSDRGRQPMHNENGTLHLVCNGEVYNYPSLRLELEASGHKFSSRSDNEVILHGYEQWGEDFLAHLEGMFAFALWDDKKRKLIAARDRIGIKPLYYVTAGEELALASTAGALLPLLHQSPEPDPTSVAYVMTLGYVPSPASIWRGIRKLEPGHVLAWQPRKGVKTQRYWEPPREETRISSKEMEEWHALFLKVLGDHLLSDVPAGLFLSSGIDSSSIAAGLRELQNPLQALTICFPGADSDELPIAKATAEHLDLPHQAIPLTHEDVNSLIRSVVSVYDEPQGYSALLTMYMISEAAARQFKVVLSGDGGDEVFGGYTWYQNLDGRPKFGTRLRRRIVRAIVRRRAIPGLRQESDRAFTDVSPLHRHAWRLFPRFLPEEAEMLLRPANLDFSDEKMLAPLRKHYEPALPLKRALQRVDLMTFCSDSILAKVDRASMAHSLEVRVPFLDRRMVERFIAAPIQSREEAESKPLLRDYLRQRVPSAVLSAPKRGFSLRVLDRFEWDLALDAIRQGPWVRAGYWHSDWEQLVQPGVPYREARIWTLLILTRWAEVWLGGRRTG